MSNLLELPEWCTYHDDDWLELPSEIPIDLLELPEESTSITDFKLKDDLNGYDSEVNAMSARGADPITPLGRNASERFRYHKQFWLNTKDRISFRAAEQSVMMMRAGFASISIEGVNHYVLKATPDGNLVELGFWSEARQRTISEIRKNPLQN